MSRDDDVSPTLTRVPVAVSSEWRRKIVATDPPRNVLHDEWELHVEPAAALPLRVVVLLRCADEMQWGFLDRAPAAAIDLVVKFFRHDWNHSEQVQVNFECKRCTVVDARLKRDPREVVEMVLPEDMVTGAIAALAEVSGCDVTVSVIAFALSDTRRRRDLRWRLDPALVHSLPSHLGSLASGSQAGTFRARTDIAG